MKLKMLKESIAGLKKIKFYIYFAACLFLLGSVIGFVNSSQLGFLDELLKELAEKVEGFNAFEMIFFIFQNNIKSAFYTILFGFFIGIFPLINALGNGVLLGYVVSKAVVIDGWITIWKLFPHGVFELPAIFIAMGLGMNLGFGFLENYFSEYKKNKKMKIYGVLSILLAFFGLFFLLSPLSLDFDTSVSSTILSNVLFVLFGFFLVMPFFLLFLSNKKIRKIQKKSFLTNIYLSIKVFLTIVLPLLIIAAIIEGLFIAYYT